MSTQFQGNSQMLARTRHVGNKIIVDVWEYSSHRTSMARARTLAREQARLQTIASVDFSVLLDYETERKVSDSEGQQHTIKIRQSSFAFQGIQ